MVSYECEHYPVLNQLETLRTIEKLAIVPNPPPPSLSPIAILISRATSDANDTIQNAMPLQFWRPVRMLRSFVWVFLLLMSNGNGMVVLLG